MSEVILAAEAGHGPREARSDCKLSGLSGQAGRPVEGLNMIGRA
jgi:hypothetical protein